jgi:stage V sporulation protein G
VRFFNFYNKGGKNMNNKPVVKVERIHRLDGDGSTKAFCDLLILDTFLVKGLRVVQGKEGLFVSMPREQGRDGKWYDTFYPVSKEMRQGLQELVLESYTEKQTA